VSGRAATLARTLRSTNAIESMIDICRDRSANVKRWRDGQMAPRWCAAGMVEAGRQFRPVNGHLHLRTLRAALERHVATEDVVANRNNDTVTAAWRSWDRQQSSTRRGTSFRSAYLGGWFRSFCTF